MANTVSPTAIPLVRFVDKRAATRAGSKTSPLAEKASYVDGATLDARLTTLNGTYFTAARLEKLTVNDKVMALRLISDAAGVK